MILQFSKELILALRKNGFLVYVDTNKSFLMSMINEAVTLSNKNDYVDTKIEGETALAYGHNKIIGFSSFDNDFKGYSSGCENILFDKFESFDKWSRCEQISKTASINEIIEILKN